MALIKCPECGKEVESNTIECPNCGAPVKELYENTRLWWINPIVIALALIGIVIMIIVLNNK